METGIATLPALLSDLAARHRDRVMIDGAQGALTFGDVEQRSADIARGLLASGVGKGEKVGLLMPNGPGWVEAFWGIVRMGGVAVLLSTFAKPRELAWLLRHADARALLTSADCPGGEVAGRLTAALPSLERQPTRAALVLREAPFLRAVWMEGDPRPSWSAGGVSGLALAPGVERLDAAFLGAIEAEITPADPAVVIYTSGSTADPKAIVHTHGTVARQAQLMSRYMTYEPGDRLMTTQPLFWVGGFCTSLLAANTCGAALVCPDAPDAAGMLRALRERAVTHIALWPAQMAALRAHPDFSPDDFARLRHTSAQQLGLFGLVPAPRTPNALGMSETFGPHSMEFPDSPLPEDRVGSFGRQVGDMERRIVDPATGQEQPPGATGEIWVRGPFLMTGFHKQEREACFEPDGFYRTGDLGWMSEDGHLFFLGRSSETLKTSGANVSPREIELLLMAQSEILEAAVVGLPDPRLGERVVAAVVLRPDAVADEAGLIARLREELSAYKVPKRILFLAEADIPRTDSAKIRKPELRARLAERLAAESAVASPASSLT